MLAQVLSRVHLFVTPWTVAHQAPLSAEFSMQEYWSRFMLKITLSAEYFLKDFYINQSFLLLVLSRFFHFDMFHNRIVKIVSKF